MAYVLINNSNRKDLSGKSTDVKPTLTIKEVSSTFYEEDTNKYYYFSSDLTWILM